MPVSPQSAIQQLREKFPHYKDLTDEHVYRIARRDFPDTRLARIWLCSTKTN